MTSIKVSTNKAKVALTPAQLIAKHTLNLKHKISEDEMKNLKIGDAANESKDINQAIEDKLAEDDLLRKHEINSYDILDA